MNRLLLPLLILLYPAVSLAQGPLPRVTEAEWGPVREQCRKLLLSMKKLDGALPAEVERKLAELLKEDSTDADAGLEKLQDLLDPLCLIGVHINPESRVKAE